MREKHHQIFHISPRKVTTISKFVVIKSFPTYAHPRLGGAVSHVEGVHLKMLRIMPPDSPAGFSCRILFPKISASISLTKMSQWSGLQESLIQYRTIHLGVLICPKLA